REHFVWCTTAPGISSPRVSLANLARSRVIAFGLTSLTLGAVTAFGSASTGKPVHELVNRRLLQSRLVCAQLEQRRLPSWRITPRQVVSELGVQQRHALLAAPGMTYRIFDFDGRGRRSVPEEHLDSGCCGPLGGVVEVTRVFRIFDDHHLVPKV